MDSEMTRREFCVGTVAAGAGMLLRSGTALAEVGGMPGGRLLHRIDCTQELPPERYFAHGQVKVVDGAGGRYREAEGKPLCRFGYRFMIENVGRPHVAVIRYPDDKRRFMCINDGTCYDLTTGVITGWAQPLSGSMLELRQIFWPRWKDCSIVFMTWSEGEPAAVASIEIHELADLPTLSVPGDPNDGSHREIGIQYEDPCGTGGSEGAMNRQEWIDRIVQYARYSGQNILAYPMAWYHGPQFPCTCEPADGFDMVVAPDRRQYSRWTTHPADWYASLLDRFAKKGLGFQGALTLMRLGSLLKGMNIDLKAIQGGAETYNNMTWNNQVQASTNDWTPIYNARNFTATAESIRGKPPIEPYAFVREYAYGERPGPANHMGPMFNPLHPTVQKAILTFVAEIGAHYGKYPAFKGISFNMFASAMPWFGSIHLGYDDHTIHLFEQETGIPVRVDARAPDRFSRRYEYLTYVCRPAWVSWRCRKIRDLFGRIHKTLAQGRPDLRVTITMWDETLITNVLGSVSAALQIHARPSMFDMFRDGGIDLDLYRDEPGLEVDLAMGNPRDRGGHGSNPCGGTHLPVEELTMYRDHDFLDRQTLDAMHNQDKPGAFIFNCWVEAWGRHVWFHPEAGDTNVAKLAVMDGKPAEGILRINSEYPKDGFWWDSQLRITPALPAGVHFLEPYAHAIAELDACRITRGGLFLDKAHGEEVRRFARAYRALPRRKFATVGKTTDPVAVRSLRLNDVLYFYVVNRDYYPVTVTVTFKQGPNGLRDLATGSTVGASQQWTLTLGSYELRSFSAEGQTEIIDCASAAPEAIVRSLTEEARQTLESFANVRGAGRFIAGMDDMDRKIRSALAENRWAYLRRTLSGYISRRARTTT